VFDLIVFHPRKKIKVMTALASPSSFSTFPLALQKWRRLALSPLCSNLRLLFV
jgi:hypothetical protein